MADERIDIDVSAALRDIAQLSSGLDGLQKKAKAAGSAFDSAFNADEAQGVADALQDLQKQYDSLKRSADVLKAANKNATNPDAIRLYTAQIAKLEAGMQRLETAGKQAGVNLQKVNKEASTGKQVFENYFGAFTKATIIIAAIDAVVKFTSYAVGLSEQIGKAQRSFEGFTGSAETAKKVVDTLIATGQKNFIPTDDILQAGKSLLAFGESADNLEPVLSRIADVSAATGKDFNELVTIYGKARTAGVLYAEDINQLVDAGVPIIQEFANQMGVSADQVKKLASEGKISFEELQLAIFNLTTEGGKFADQAQNNAATIGGAWTKLLATIQPVTEGIGGFLSDLATGFLLTLDSLAQGIGNLFTDSIEAAKEANQAGKEEMYADRREYEANLKFREDLEKKAEEARRKLREKARQDKESADKKAQQEERELQNLNVKRKGVLLELKLV